MNTERQNHIQKNWSENLAGNEKQSIVTPNSYTAEPRVAGQTIKSRNTGAIWVLCFYPSESLFCAFTDLHLTNGRKKGINNQIVSR